MGCPDRPPGGPGDGEGAVSAAVAGRCQDGVRPPADSCRMTNTSTSSARLTAPLGQFQEIDGRRLFIHRSGEGGPAVVFLPGASAVGLDYYGLQQQVARFTTAVVYDRGGTGYSDPLPLPRTAEAVAVELHRLLHAQNIPGPYVLVAHSLGGAYAHRFAQLYPRQVAGLVWLDAFHRDWDRYMPAEASLAAGERIAPTLEQLQQALPFMRDMVADMFADYPPHVRDAMIEYHVSDAWIHVGMAERGTLVSLAHELQAGPDIPDVPVIALTPTGVDPGQQALMPADTLQAIHDGKTRLDAALAASVSRGQQRVLPDTDHSRLIVERADVDLASSRKENTAMPITLTEHDKHTLRIAAYGAVTLLSFADAAGSPHKVATNGSLALHAATGPIGHVLSDRTRTVKLNAKSAAALADQVLPALTESMALLRKQDPAEAENFRGTVLIALDAATRAAHSPQSPTTAEMTRKITQALNAA
jgi:pimeloyl-ACP methyl ester carboxylesterase